MFSLLICLFLQPSTCQKPIPSIFSGFWHINSNDLFHNSTLLFKLYFYQKQNESNQYMMKTINSTAKDIIKAGYKDETLYVIGTVKINDDASLKFFKSKKTPFVGIYKTETSQFYLAQSIEPYLSNNIINEIQYRRPPIIKNSQLISLMLNIEKLFKDSLIKTPTIDSTEDEKNNFFDQLQSNANKEYKNLTIIFLELTNTKKAPKLYYKCNLRGFIPTNLMIEIRKTYLLFFSKREYIYPKYIELNAYQFKILSFVTKVEIADIVSFFFLSIHFLLLFIIKNDKIASIQINVSFPILYFLIYYYIDNAFYDFKGLAFDLYKYIRYGYLLVILFTIYLKVQPLLHSYIYKGIDNNVRNLEATYRKVVFYVIIDILYYLFIVNNDDYYSVPTLIILFSNLFISLGENSSILTANITIFEIVSTFIRFFDLSFHYLYYKNLILVEKNGCAPFVFVFILLVIFAFLLIRSHIEMGFLPIDLFRKLKIGIKSYNYYGKKVANNEECPICLLPMKPEEQICVVTPCNHAFHEKCFKEWLEHTPNDLICPTCRQPIPPLKF